METSLDHYLVILCGGTGPRLWPLSRADFPKQFLTINNRYSLLQSTILRCKKVVPASHVFIVSNKKYLPLLKKQTGTLIPHKNILIEPEKKNTLAAIIYAATRLNNLSPNPVITTIPADHLIKDTDNFVKSIKETAILSKKNKIVTIGIKPTFPNPSYGYIVPQASFIEKPDTKLAQKLIDRGALWNSGIYTFTYQTLLNELALHQRDIFNLSKLIQEHPTNKNTVSKFFHQVPSIAIDIAISEKTKNLTTVTARFDWSDIGEWKTIFKSLIKKPSDNVTLNNQTKFLHTNSTGCLISAPKNKFIGLVNVKDLAIIDTPDSLLVCYLPDSFQVRDLISQVVKQKSTEKYFLKSYDRHHS